MEIFFRKGVRSVDKKGKETLFDLEDKIDFALFPSLQVCIYNQLPFPLVT